MSIWSKTKEFFAWLINDVPRAPIMPPMDGALPEQPEEKVKKPRKSSPKKKPSVKAKPKRKTSSKKK